MKFNYYYYICKMEKVFKYLMLLSYLIIGIGSYSQGQGGRQGGGNSSCPNLDNNNNNPNFNAQVYVTDINGNIIDSVGCSVAGESGNYNCESIADSLFYMYISENGDTCFYDSDGNIGQLPVELNYFTVLNDNEVNLIKWSTFTETNNEYFILEHSYGNNIHEISTNWSKITEVDGCGTCSYTNYYGFEHYNYKHNEVNYYRLTQYDYDGKYETFNIISIDNRKNKKIIKILNTIGQEVNMDYKGVKIIIYEDGTRIKKM